MQRLTCAQTPGVCASSRKCGKLTDIVIHERVIAGISTKTN